MGTIIPRKRKDGSTGYQAQILIKRDGKIQHRETKTFDRRQAAAAWLEGREGDLTKPGAIERAKASDPPLSAAIDRYTAEAIKEIGRTKAQVLRAIKGYPLAAIPCARITSVDIVAFAKAKLDEGVKPQTVANYLSHLAGLFSVAGPAWGYRLDRDAMSDAQKVAARVGLISKAGQRDRRPTLDELDRMMTHIGERRAVRPYAIPMQKIIAFAIFSTRRQEEITRIAWKDLDHEGKRVLVRDMKNPGEKIGNHVWCDLPDPALAVITSMPRVAEEIFPFAADTISASFTRMCQFLAIEDLHFHDLRHDGVSRLFEMGKTIPHVAAVSGHRSWPSLKRYTHLRQAGDKYAGWKWIGPATT